MTSMSVDAIQRASVFRTMTGYRGKIIKIPGNAGCLSVIDTKKDYPGCGAVVLNDMFCLVYGGCVDED